MEEQVKYLMSTIGLTDAPVSRFHVEYVAKGGGYSMSQMSASTLSEVAEMTIEDKKHKGNIVIIHVDPIENNIQKKLALKNHPRVE